MNSSISATEQSIYEIIYNFKPNQFLDLTVTLVIPQLKSFTVCINTVDVLVFVNMNAKHYYDRNYISMFFKKDDFVYLRLYQNYNISANVAITRKLGQQYAGLFKIL